MHFDNHITCIHSFYLFGVIEFKDYIYMYIDKLPGKKEIGHSYMLIAKEKLIKSH